MQSAVASFTFNQFGRFQAFHWVPRLSSVAIVTANYHVLFCFLDLIFQIYLPRYTFHHDGTSTDLNHQGRDQASDIDIANHIHPPENW